MCPEEHGSGRGCGHRREAEQLGEGRELGKGGECTPDGHHQGEEEDEDVVEDGEVPDDRWVQRWYWNDADVEQERCAQVEDDCGHEKREGTTDRLVRRVTEIEDARVGNEVVLECDQDITANFHQHAHCGADRSFRGGR